MLESPKDSVLQEDLEYIANGNIPLDELRDKTILVTGATGLIGSQIVKALLCCNRVKNANIKVLAFVRNEQKRAISLKIFRKCKKQRKIRIFYQNVCETYTKWPPLLFDGVVKNAT